MKGKATPPHFLPFPAATLLPFSFPLFSPISTVILPSILSLFPYLSPSIVERKLRPNRGMGLWPSSSLLLLAPLPPSFPSALHTFRQFGDIFKIMFFFSH